LINKIEERGWAILNGSFGKEDGWTHIAEVGSSVIDDIIGNDRATGKMKLVEEGNRMESDISYTIKSRVDRTADDKKK